MVLTGSYPITELGDETRRKKWIAAQLQKVTQSYADGFNIDIEDATRNGTSDTKLLSVLVEEMYQSFKKFDTNYQVWCGR